MASSSPSKAYLCSTVALSTGALFSKSGKISRVGCAYIAPPKTFLLPENFPRSINTTFFPALAIVIAQEIPAGPPPTTITSVLFSCFDRLAPI